MRPHEEITKLSIDQSFANPLKVGSIPGRSPYSDDRSLSFGTPPKILGDQKTALGDEAGY
jgi:hypothetical protein